MWIAAELTDFFHAWPLSVLLLFFRSIILAIAARKPTRMSELALFVLLDAMNVDAVPASMNACAEG